MAKDRIEEEKPDAKAPGQEEQKLEEQELEEEFNDNGEDPRGFLRSIRTPLIIIIAIALLFGASLIYNNYRDHEPSDGDTIRYNEFTFIKEGPVWRTDWVMGNQPYILKFRNTPAELEDVPIEGRLNLLFNNSRDIYLTFDPHGGNYNNLAIAASQLSLSLSAALGKNAIGACTVEDTEECFERPIVTCDDEDKAVIYLRNDERTVVSLEGNCMIISGEGPEVIRSAERILFYWYGIMPLNP